MYDLCMYVYMYKLHELYICTLCRALFTFCVYVCLLWSYQSVLSKAAIVDFGGKYCLLSSHDQCTHALVWHGWRQTRRAHVSTPVINHTTVLYPRLLAGVHMLGGVSYEKVDDAGLHVKVDGDPRLLEVDNVVVCAGQEPLKDLEVQY